MVGVSRPPVPVIQTDPLSAALATATTWEPSVTASLGDEPLGSVPVVSGSVTMAERTDVLGQVDMVIPRFVDGFDWCPKDDPTHPLAHFGQEFAVGVQTRDVTGAAYDERLGTFAVHSWDADDDSVNVTGYTALKSVEEARFTVPQAPQSGGTLASEFVRLMGGIAPVVIDGSLVDRAVPASMSWGDDRLAALYDIAAAWPARLRVDSHGVVYVLPPLGSEIELPSYALRDGEGGTVTSRKWSSSRDQTFNRVVARGTESDEAGRPAVYGYAQVETGPLSVSGPNGIQTAYMASPLLTTRPAAFAAAATRLANLNRPSITVPITVAADPRVRLDDAVEATYLGSRVWGWVVGYEVPLVIRSAADVMRVDLAVSS